MPKRKPEELQETDQALQAFEDFWAMGEARSLPKLCALYRGRSESGEDVPTTRFPTLKHWSARWHWQDRAKQRILEEANQRRATLRARTVKHRERVIGAIEVDTARYLQRLRDDPKAFLAEDAASLERMTKLYFQLAEEPLAERTLHGNDPDNPLPAQPSSLLLLADPEACALATKLIGRLSGGGEVILDESQGTDEAPDA